MFYLDVQYARRIAYKLNRFKVKKDNGNVFEAAFRCPICGDSEKSEAKTRGGLYTKDSHLYMHCFNCNANMHFGQFLKHIDFPLWEEYKLEKFKHNVKYNPPKEPVKHEPVFINPAWSDGLERIDLLNDDHRAKMYLTKRMIPKDKLNLFYYAPKFFEWSRSNTDKFKDAHTDDHERIVMPWFDKDGRFFAYQARAMGDEQPKYYSIVLDKSVPRIYGLDRIDWNKKIYCVEGPMDSLFLDNAVAVGTSALYMFQTDDQEVIYVPDNENRNKEILKVYSKLIKLGKNVAIPPDNCEFKDINDAIIEKFDVKSMIDDNIYSGLRAQVKLNEWKRVDYES